MSVEVITFHHGTRYDEAEPEDTAESMISCARRLFADYREAGHRRRDFTVGFYRDGVLVRMATAQDLQPLASCDIALEIAAKSGAVSL